MSYGVLLNKGRHLVFYKIPLKEVFISSKIYFLNFIEFALFSVYLNAFKNEHICFLNQNVRIKSID